MTRTLAVLAVVAVALSVTGCSKAMEPYQDAPRSEVRNADPADLITFPDGFSNVATKCDHGNRVYVLFKGNSSYGSVAVVPNDPTC